LPDTSGASAIAVAVAVALGTRIPLLPWRLPVLPGVLERVYARIADNRRRFRGNDPWCAQHPEHCSGAGAASCSIEQT